MPITYQVSIHALIKIKIRLNYRNNCRNITKLCFPNTNCLNIQVICTGFSFCLHINFIEKYLKIIKNENYIRIYKDTRIF